MYQGLETVASRAPAPVITSLCPCHLSHVGVVVSVIAVGASGVGVFRGWPFIVVVVEVTVK